MDKIDWLKYSAFILAFIILFLPNNTAAWIWASVLAGILLLIWVFKIYGFRKVLLSSALIFAILVIVSDSNSTEQKWFIWLCVISLLTWGIIILWGNWTKE